ncbi:hypothetical protein RND71_035278 [Anisodus tanguticus]|uniref:Uncharacterized protein n=1 Tax=Anisodus tanguticus TaxID=243964 RepID=A0AAE1R6T9_9SOLA|nr:hypothetical protein RND71_035278 [Anisodus tanguticus]
MSRPLLKKEAGPSEGTGASTQEKASSPTFKTAPLWDVTPGSQRVSIIIIPLGEISKSREPVNVTPSEEVDDDDIAFNFMLKRNIRSYLKDKVSKGNVVSIRVQPPE